jgi:hypothetical protein
VKKPYKFLATSGWIQKVARKCTCPRKKHMQLMTDVGGKKTGNRELLKGSQAYPDLLGEALIEAWGSAPPSGQLVDVAAHPSAECLQECDPSNPSDNADSDDNPWGDNGAEQSSGQQAENESTDDNPWGSSHVSDTEGNNPWADTRIRNTEVSSDDVSESPWAGLSEHDKHTWATWAPRTTEEPRPKRARVGQKDEEDDNPWN